MSAEKTYEPYFIIVWRSENVLINKKGEFVGVAVKEVPYREDACEEYNDLLQKGVQDMALAKLVKKHGDG